MTTASTPSVEIGGIADGTHVYEKNGGFFADCKGNPSNDIEEAQERAAMVVRAVNGRKELAEALNFAMPSLRDDVERLRQSLSGPSITIEQMQEYEQIKWNLEKAETALKNAGE